GFHANLPAGLSRAIYTEILIRSFAQSPGVDIISHPNLPGYPVDTDLIAEAARESNTALEINNSKVLFEKVEPHSVEELIHSALRYGCSLVLSSDTHALKELGRVDLGADLIRRAGAEHLVLNRSVRKVEKFLAERRSAVSAADK
ncbi:MAG: hypothetical protein ACQEQV_09590, partial [Fibrobacterota bacterium]